MPYTKDGIKYPRCTNIIGDCTDKSGALVGWATACCIEWIRENYPSDTYPGCYLVCGEELNQARFAYKTVSDKALDVGSQVHAFIELYLNSKINKSETTLKMVDKYEKLPGEVQNAFDAFQNWEKDHNLKPIELEKTVYGSRWAGTLDFYGYFDDKLYVIDWKTSKPRNKKTGKGIYPENRYQVAAYRYAIQNGVYEEATIYANDISYQAMHDGGRHEPLLPHYYDYIAKNGVQGCGVLRLDKETGMPDWCDTSKTYKQDLRVFNRMVDLYFERHPIVAKRFEGIIPF